MFKRKLWISVFIIGIAAFFPIVGFCTVESSLAAIQSKLTDTFLPLAAILGILFAAFSFVSGSPNARMHMWLAIFGCAIGFGASSIVSLIRSLIN